MEDQYGMSDLRQLIVGGGRPFLPPVVSPPTPFPGASRSLTTDNLPYYMLNFRPDAPTATNNSVFEATEAAGGCGAGRWPRQETLTLLEIRSRLDPKFKEANQKGPLWDELSRIMCEEYGYQRSGKKCREKFENLYKYYKKTKGGKAGRQDGKHYRFFRQLEALYGGGDDHQTTHHMTSNNNQDSSHATLISISNSSDFDTFVSSDEDNSDHDDALEINTRDDSKGKMKTAGRGRSLKEKIKESIDSQMKEMMEKQEAWMEKMMRTIEVNEQERIQREEQWRRQDVERIEREQRMWASEKAWIQARDAALMDAFMKMAGKEARGDVYSTREEELMAGFGRDDDRRSSRIGTSQHHHHHHQQNDRESISEQGIDHGSSPPDYNAMSGGGFRYFGGDGYGGL